MWSKYKFLGFPLVKKFSQKEAKLLNQALAFCQQGNLQEGKNILQFLYSDFPNHPDVLSPLGAIKLQEGYIDDGIFKLAQSLKLNPRQPAALNNLGNAYLELKKYEEALIAFEKTIQMQPNFVDAHYNQGRAHSALKDYKKAILAYQKQLTLIPIMFGHASIKDIAIFNLNNMKRHKSLINKH